MERKVLVDEIIDLFLELGVLKDLTNLEQTKNNMEKQIENAEFVELIYNVIFIRAKEQRMLDIKRIIDILQELNRIRIKLESEQFITA